MPHGPVRRTAGIALATDDASSGTPGTYNGTSSGTPGPQSDVSGRGAYGGTYGGAYGGMYGAAHKASAAHPARYAPQTGRYAAPLRPGSASQGSVPQPHIRPTPASVVQTALSASSKNTVAGAARAALVPAAAMPAPQFEMTANFNAHLLDPGDARTSAVESRAAIMETTNRVERAMGKLPPKPRGSKKKSQGSTVVESDKGAFVGRAPRVFDLLEYDWLTHYYQHNTPPNDYFWGPKRAGKGATLDMFWYTVQPPQICAYCGGSGAIETASERVYPCYIHEWGINTDGDVVSDIRENAGYSHAEEMYNTQCRIMKPYQKKKQLYSVDGVIECSWDDCGDDFKWINSPLFAKFTRKARHEGVGQKHLIQNLTDVDKKNRQGHDESFIFGQNQPQPCKDMYTYLTGVLFDGGSEGLDDWKDMLQQYTKAIKYGVLVFDCNAGGGPESLHKAIYKITPTDPKTRAKGLVGSVESYVACKKRCDRIAKLESEVGEKKKVDDLRKSGVSYATAPAAPSDVGRQLATSAVGGGDSKALQPASDPRVPAREMRSGGSGGSGGSGDYRPSVVQTAQPAPSSQYAPLTDRHSSIRPDERRSVLPPAAITWQEAERQLASPEPPTFDFDRVDFHELPVTDDEIVRQDVSGDPARFDDHTNIDRGNWRGVSDRQKEDRHLASGRFADPRLADRR